MLNLLVWTSFSFVVMEKWFALSDRLEVGKKNLGEVFVRVGYWSYYFWIILKAGNCRHQEFCRVWKLLLVCFDISHFHFYWWFRLGIGHLIDVKWHNKYQNWMIPMFEYFGPVRIWKNQSIKYVVREFFSLNCF